MTYGTADTANLTSLQQILSYQSGSLNNIVSTYYNYRNRLNRNVISKKYNYRCYGKMEWKCNIFEYIYGQSQRLQESCDPSSVLVCSDLHLCSTILFIEVMHRPFRKCIVIHSLDKKKCAFDHCNAIKMTFLACRQLEFLS